MAKAKAGFDQRRAESAIRELLASFGLDPQHPDFAETPERAAKAWIETLIAGYREDPDEVLGEGFPTKSRVAVIASGIPFVSVCPHHLLPLTGRAHLGFKPAGRVPGFGRIARLIDTLAHRLVLQEELTESIVQTLERALGVEAAVCVLEARHTCVAATDPARAGAKFRTVAAIGRKAAAAELLREIEQRERLDALPPVKASSSKKTSRKTGRKAARRR